MDSINNLDELKLILDIPNLYLANYFLDLKNQIDLELYNQLESNFEESNQIWIEFIERVNEFETQCFKHLKFIKLKVNNDFEDIFQTKENQLVKLISKEKLKKNLFLNQSIIFIYKNKWKWLNLLFGKDRIKTQLVLVKDEYLSDETFLNISDLDFIMSNNIILINRVLNSRKLKLKLFFDIILECDKNIKEIMLNLKNVETLDLFGNRIISIEKESFIDLLNLKTLLLSYNLISSLNSNSFNCLKNLKVLNLSHNKIKSFDINLFKDLVNLNELNLSHNPVEIFNYDILKNLINLQILKLNSLDIKDIPMGSLKNLTNLRELNLSNNKIKIIEEKSFIGMISLKELWLNHNQIEEIKANVFDDLKKLESIDFYMNKITLFDLNSLISLSSLDYINLDCNPINEIDIFYEFLLKQDSKYSNELTEFFKLVF